MNGKYTAVIVGLVLLAPLFVSAENFQPLVGIPGVTDSETGSLNLEGNGFGNYVNAMYAVAIGVAGVLAVIKLIIAGAKYMLSEIVSTKQDAKNDIKWALIGLLVVLGAVLILTTINADLTNTDIAPDTVSIERGDSILTAVNNATAALRTESERRCNDASAAGRACVVENCTDFGGGVVEGVIGSTLSQFGESCQNRCENRLNGVYNDRGLNSIVGQCTYDPELLVEEACIAAGGTGDDCVNYDCQLLEDRATIDYVAAGAGMGAGAGVVLGPGIFWTTVGGAAGGALVGFATSLVGDEVACQAVCRWYSGEFTHTEMFSGKSCVYPKDTPPNFPEPIPLTGSPDVITIDGLRLISEQTESGAEILNLMSITGEFDLQIDSAMSNLIVYLNGNSDFNYINNLYNGNLNQTQLENLKSAVNCSGDNQVVSYVANYSSATVQINCFAVTE